MLEPSSDLRTRLYETLAVIEKLNRDPSTVAAINSPIVDILRSRGMVSGPLRITAAGLDALERCQTVDHCCAEEAVAA